MRVEVSSPQFSLWRKKNWLFFDVSAGCLNYWRDPKINPRWYWRCLLYWQVMFKSKVCSCACMEREWWRLLRMSATQNVLPCLEIPCKDQKLTFMLFGTDGSYCFVKNTSRYYENEKPSLFFSIIFSANRNQPHPNLCRKRQKSYSINGIIVSTPHWLIQLTKNSSPFSFFTFFVYKNETWFSPSLTMVLSGLSTLDQIQWLWLRKISSKNGQ